MPPLSFLHRARFFIQQKDCIDLTSAMDDFTKWFTTNKKDLIIKVKYE